MRIHKEGHTFLLVSFLVTIVITISLVYILKGYPILCYVIIFLAMVFYGLLVQFFRNPVRITVQNERHIIAPADGKIVVIEETKEQEYFNDNRIQISIFMSPLNVHVNRNPISGEVKYVKYHKGKYLVAWHPKSSTENERTTIVIQHARGHEILIRQIAGALAKRIKCYLKEKEQVVQGQELGFIKFGSRVDVFVPVDSEITTHIGATVKGGISVLALLKQ
ncbi:MAG: phosphatidylserine decarboxylase family protein [Cytophagaceae bacterium]|nr:phosphatidylserine decarboxylase family protein [Cytophagaceae bacterium]MDW8455184.1 phosphatidylserine decarboxylase family protein [Cytophagaceae bacterium]